MEQVTLGDIPIPPESNTVILRNLKGNGNTEKKGTNWTANNVCIDGCRRIWGLRSESLGAIHDVENFRTTEDVVWTRDV